MKNLFPKTIVMAFIFANFFASYAQELGDFKPKDDGFKTNKIGEGPKKLYIANFTINFEMYKEAIDKKAAGGFGRTIKGAAKAKAAIGLATLDKEAIQAKANQLYNEFVAEFKNKGYEIISAEKAGITDTYKNWKKASGPEVFETDMKGIIAVVPADFSYYYKDRNAFSSKFGNFAKTSQNLSKELDNALIADVSLIYVFCETGTDWNIGNQAKVKLLVNYRLAAQHNVSDEKTGAGITSMFDKSKQAVGLSSTVNFTRGKLPIGGSPESQYIGLMKSDLEIDGVLKKEKVIAFSTQKQITATLLNPVVSIIGQSYSETAKWLEPDGKKYAEGIYLAGTKFIKYHLAEVMSKL